MHFASLILIKKLKLKKRMINSLDLYQIINWTDIN